MTSDETKKDLSAHKISITDSHHELSNTTSTLVKEVDSTEDKSNMSNPDNSNEASEIENDSVMRRNIDSLHQSISNMRDEFLER